MAKRQHRVLHLVFFFCFFWISAAPAAAPDIPKVIAIQHRNYHLTDELTAYVGYMPLDSFTTYFNVNASYTHYFSDFLAWEVVNASYANSATTGIREYIANNYFGTVAQGYDIINYFFTTNVVYTPLYMKSLVFGSKIGYGDISFVGGGGITKYNGAGNVNTFDLGLIMRYFISPHWSLKFDFRNYFFITADLKNNMTLEVGLAYNFGNPSDEVTDE